ncbi:type II toxin-antitoxin system Phd/YefM family antitoxin [Streptosporangium amethystogenes]|uniref:type II toxin-antitoxin system Phd/YefM family antitoxin n=1 Tax=Streptosporangium amethystogenes TaxID=2002 RepID=UPI0014707E79|nr:type II toxin-antitoxin system prevent-host-death family antitoxin [Streptosporangium amethystogenes]
MHKADISKEPDPPGEVEEIGIREARVRLAELVERAGAGEPVVLRRRGPQRNAAALLPIEAVEVWQAHLAAQEAELRRRAEETTLGERRPAGTRGAVCPGCRSSFMHVVFTGPVVIALVNTADPAADVQAAVADTDPAMAQEVAFVRCASCWEPMGTRPREHGAGLPRRRRHRRERLLGRRAVGGGQPLRRRRAGDGAGLTHRAGPRPGPRKGAPGHPLGMADRYHR